MSVTQNSTRDVRLAIVDGLWRAIGVLTVYPLPETESWTPATVGSAMVFYPLVGALIGISLWMLYVMLSALFAPPSHIMYPFGFDVSI